MVFLIMRVSSARIYENSGVMSPVRVSNLSVEQRLYGNFSLHAIEIKSFVSKRSKTGAIAHSICYVLFH